jgi:hypothetical protein
MKASNSATFLASFTLATADIIRLRITAGTPEAWIWGVLTLVSVGVMLLSAAAAMPREEGAE